MAELTLPSDELRAALAGRSPAVRDAVKAILAANDASAFAAAERAVHEVERREIDALVALALQARVSDPQFREESRSMVHAAAKEVSAQMRSKGTKSTPVRLLGGTVVPMLALFMLPATPRDPAARKKKGVRGPGGAGVYPALARLGVIDQATPALREAVAHQVAASRSVEAAREALKRQGILVDHKAALRFTYRFADAAMAARDSAFDALPNDATGEAAEPLGQASGRRLVVSLDGGRVRLKETSSTLKPGDRTFTPQWREPKLLTIYAIDEQGKRDRDFPSVIDVTMGDADQAAALLVGHLRLLGAQHAAHVRFIADGGLWIWERTEQIRHAVGIPSERWSEQLDLPHLIAYLGRVIEPLTEEQIGRKVWLSEQKAALLSGQIDEVIGDLGYLAQTHHLDTSAAIRFLEFHRARLYFLFCRPDGQPLGSGGVESAVRRVVNLRVKGNSIYWLREHAEAVMHLRSHVVTGRWDELVTRTLARPVWQPRTPS